MKFKELFNLLNQSLSKLRVQLIKLKGRIKRLVAYRFILRILQRKFIFTQIFRYILIGIKTVN